MIRKKVFEPALFYDHSQIARPSSKNFYVRLNAVIKDWGSLCGPLHSVFSLKNDGRPVDPIVYFKIYLVGYFENIEFDTDLDERISDSIAIREFLGYRLDESTPDHSSIGRVRSRLNESGQLQSVLDLVVGLCNGAGLLGGDETAVDSTLMKANASLSSLKNVETKESVREHLNRLEEAGEKPSVSNKVFRSTTDPDARISKKGTTCPRGMYHKATHVTDSKNQVIVSVHVSRADVGDPEAAIPALAQAKSVLEANGLKLETVVGDAGYDDSKFHAHVESLGATPITNYTVQKGGKEEGFTKASFKYDADKDVYVCPNGAELKLDSRTGTQAFYHSSPSDCAACPFRASCLAKKSSYRTINRSKNEDARLRNIARCHTDEGRKALKKRKTVVEPPFGHMKRLGGMRGLNCRGEKRVNSKVTMAAIAWNLMKLVKKAVADGLNELATAIFIAISIVLATIARPQSKLSQI
jgi:transposase